MAEFPVFSWRMMPFTYHETDRLLYQPYHHQKLYNGASGFTPPVREKDWEWLWQHFPQPETIAYLDQQGVELLLVDLDIYRQLQAAGFSYAQTPTPDPTQLLTNLASQSGVTNIGCTTSACLYTIHIND